MTDNVDLGLSVLAGSLLVLVANHITAKTPLIYVVGAIFVLAGIFLIYEG